MSGMLILTESPAPIPIIQGTYRWLLAQSDEQQMQSGHSDWSFEIPCRVAQQYELFAPYVTEKSTFQEHVNRWRRERGTSSSTTEIVLCPSYQAIIGMGRAVAVPLILAQIEAEEEHPDQWFWALQVLTGANPVSEEDEGNFPKMAQSWLQWARWHYVW